MVFTCISSVALSSTMFSLSFFFLSFFLVSEFAAAGELSPEVQKRLQHSMCSPRFPFIFTISAHVFIPLLVSYITFAAAYLEVFHRFVKLTVLFLLSESQNKCTGFLYAF
ncbi:hypothetical protein M758_7G100400 [Ceratodon purpureus]|uniref:Uncharacterized protein n=1 Tax=Ceratodon purpureus TaxID=3225 RepID=A0A8T0H738_CERPU|nr:hypothetical protein KC19_7G106600 [Ceratodon purpureus]KAG0610902.1 hypothetical protein M758_7G100400 [Ceratodon purpureus]